MKFGLAGIGTACDQKNAEKGAAIVCSYCVLSLGDVANFSRLFKFEISWPESASIHLVHGLSVQSKRRNTTAELSIRARRD